MNTKKFENKRWKKHKQQLEFRHRSAFEMVFNLREVKNVLDLGCGDGVLIDLLKKKGINVVGADISSEAIVICKKKGHNVALIDLASSSLPFANKSFDLIFLLDVLEHLYSPEDFLKDVTELSRRYLIISVPNFNSLAARIQILLGRVPENNKPSKGHIYWFNKKELEKMFKNMNLTLIELKTNTFWENIFGVKYLIKFLKTLFPNIFALSFTALVNVK